MDGFNKFTTSGPIYNGVEISQEEYERIFNKYKRELNELYDARVNVIIDTIKKSTISTEKRLDLLYSYFVNQLEIDDSYLSGITSSGTAEPIYYKFKDYDIKFASSTNKYGPIIFGKGVCKGFSEAFKDICDKMGIKCDVVIGKTFMWHGWNVVLINGEPKMIDCFYGITERRCGRDPKKYLLISSEQLKTYKTHFNYEESLAESTKKITNPGLKVKRINANEQDSEKSLDFRIISRSDTKDSRVSEEFKTLSRTDNQPDTIDLEIISGFRSTSNYMEQPLSNDNLGNNNSRLKK